MQILRYILKNITILNIILMCCLSLTSYFVILPLLDMNVNIALPSFKKNETENLINTTQVQMPALSDYMLIADQNLFHPERKIPEKKEEKQLPKPEFVLYGTLISDTASIAYMEDMKAPYNTTGRGKRQKAIQKGATFSGFVLSEIHHDKVVMLRGEERIEVSVLDQQNKKSRGTETTASAPTGLNIPQPSQEIKSPAEQPVRSRTQVTTSPSPSNQRTRPIPNRPTEGQERPVRGRQ